MLCSPWLWSPRSPSMKWWTSEGLSWTWWIWQGLRGKKTHTQKALDSRWRFMPECRLILWYYIWEFYFAYICLSALLLFQEASSINRSLMCLSQVIMALVDVSNGKNRHICYRDSKLTFLLRVSDCRFKMPFGCCFSGDCLMLLWMLLWKQWHCICSGTVV